MEAFFLPDAWQLEREPLTRFRGDIPREVTQKVLEKQPALLQSLPVHTATLFEQLPMQALQEGCFITGCELAQRFVDQGGFKDVKQRLDHITTLARDVELNEAMLQYRAKSIMFYQLEELGVPLDLIDNIFNAPITFKNRFHPNYCINSSEIELTRLNIMRRTLDYQAVFGTEIDVQDLAQIITQRIIAHEIGHVVDGVLGYPSLETSVYDLRNNSITARAERFAEYWGRSQFDQDSKEAEIIENEALLQVAGTYHMWKIIDSYDEVVPQNTFCILEYFDHLHMYTRGDQHVLDHLDTRQRHDGGFYNGTEPEFYAAPYSQQVVTDAIQRQLQKLS